jgi:hypothetical protein
MLGAALGAGVPCPGNIRADPDQVDPPDRVNLLVKPMTPELFPIQLDRKNL